MWRWIPVNSECAWLKVNVSALAAGNTENLLAFRTNDYCCFGSAATTKNASRCRADNMFTERNKEFDLFCWRQIRDRLRIYKDPDGAG